MHKITIKMNSTKPKYWSLLLCAAASLSLSACNTLDRLDRVGEAPAMEKIENPTLKEDYQPVSLPMPTPKVVKPEKNSLWAADRTTFFKDQRAKDVGDIITVLIDIADEAQIDNSSSRTRSAGEDAQAGALLGYEADLAQVLPEAVVNTDLIDATSTSNHTGAGTIDREEEITVKLAALVTQILPNGNMVVNGKQEVLVNFEKRILSVDGVIRPEDISVNNTVNYDQIAEARIIYGGEGQISDVQQPRYGQQIYDVVFPF